MTKTLPKTLAGRVQILREKYNLSREKLAELSNIDICTINNIEEGIDTFLSASMRQRLSKPLKISSNVLKEVEVKPSEQLINPKIIKELEDKILYGQLENNKCPKCGNLLICKVLTLYDLEDNPVKHAKARCSKCPFQIK